MTKVNRLWSNLVWSNIDSFPTIPTDCPQRNERMGWSGDISVFSRTATYGSQAGPFLARPMKAMRDVQSAAGRFADVAPVGDSFGGLLWGSAGIVVPWEAGQHCRDRRLLEENHKTMAACLSYLETAVDPRTGISSDSQPGDWLGPQNNQLGSAFLASAYRVCDLAIMARVAGIPELPSEESKYRELYLRRKELFNRTLLSRDRKAPGLIGGRRGFGGQVAVPPERKPAGSAEEIMEEGRAASGAVAVTFRKYDRGKAVFELQSGEYRFTVPYRNPGR